jgi:hypothetical protein
VAFADGCPAAAGYTLVVPPPLVVRRRCVAGTAAVRWEIVGDDRMPPRNGRMSA